MALVKEQIQEVEGGIKKEFAPESIDMMMDLVQKFQYQKPVKSTIRELATNAVDAIKEREIAKEILSGKAKVSDYYVEATSDVSKESKFDPSYYDLKWLSDDDEVRIIYEERGQDKDLIRIIDNGVGLGGRRLEKYFQLGFSSKRLSIWALGKFGIGGKAALSTGEPYYTLKSRYNGREFEFNIYSYKVESIIPPVDISTGRANDPYVFENGHVVFSRPTTERNGVEIAINVKKYRKQEYLDGVRSQLLYFDNIHLFHKLQVPGSSRPADMAEIEVKANILYEDDFLIISDNKQFSKPHVVLDKVNYGYIHFDELQLEELTGNVGIKVSQEDVTVNPSREALVWDEVTRATVLKRFKAAAVAATKIVSESLKEKDFVKWLKKYLAISSDSKSNDGLLSQLGGIVDLNNINPLYMEDKTLQAAHVPLLFPAMQLQKVYIGESDAAKDGSKRRVLKRSVVKEFGEMNPGSKWLLIDTEEYDNRAMKYLADQAPFYLVTYNSKEDFSETALKRFTESAWEDTELGYLSDNEADVIASTLFARRERVYKLLKKSKEITNVNDVVVPDDWQLNEEIQGPDIVNTRHDLSPKEKRELEERVVAFTPINGNQWQKVEPKLKTLLSFDPEKVYWGGTDDAEMLRAADSIVSPVGNRLRNSFYDGRIMPSETVQEWGLHNSYWGHWQYISSYGPDSPYIILKTSEVLSKRLKGKFKHIADFFYRVEDGILTVAPEVVRWNTARLIDEQLTVEYEYMNSFKRLNPERFKQFRKLVEFHKKHDRHVLSKDVKTFMDQLVEVQLMEDPEYIKAATKKYFGEEFRGAIGVDMKIYNSLQNLLNYVGPIHAMMSTVFPEDMGDISDYNRFSEELEKELRFYITAKGL